MEYEIKILGCGGSNGCPDIEKGWGSCNPLNLKNYRTRSSALISIKNANTSIKDFSIKNNTTDNLDEKQVAFNLLIDVSPDFRQQALSNNVKNIDAILFTHHHADHIYGIDDLRPINRLIRKAIPCYATSETYDVIRKSFHYVFEGKPTSVDNFFKPSLNFEIIDYFKLLKLTNNVSIKTTLQNHGSVNTVGYIINNKIGYACDFLTLPEETINEYKNLDLMIVSAFTMKEHVSHMKLDTLLELIKIISPKLTILTHMGIAMDYDYLIKNLPSNVHPAYDGMIISNSNISSSN